LPTERIGLALICNGINCPVLDQAAFSTFLMNLGGNGTIQAVVSVILDGEEGGHHLHRPQAISETEQVEKEISIAVVYGGKRKLRSGYTWDQLRARAASKFSIDEGDVDLTMSIGREVVSVTSEASLRRCLDHAKANRMFPEFDLKILDAKGMHIE